MVKSTSSSFSSYGRFVPLSLLLLLLGINSIGTTEALIPLIRLDNNRAIGRTSIPSTTTTTALYSSSDDNNFKNAGEDGSNTNNSDPIQRARLRLEMHWGMEEAAENCIVEDPTTCGSDVCPDCRGTGRVVCRFCRGTKALYQDGQFHKCPVCNSEGTETCHSCAGTGYIAEWTQTPPNNDNENEKLRP